MNFEKFIKLVEDNKNLNNLLFSPTVGKTNQGKILNDILKKGKADKLTINFCGILCRNGRVNLITKIMREFLNEVARRRGEIVVEVFSPYKLDKKGYNFRICCLQSLESVMPYLHKDQITSLVVPLLMEGLKDPIPNV